MSSINLEEQTINGLQAKMASGEWTARAIAEAYLERIKTLDVQTNAIIELNPDALGLADDLDAERAQSGARGPLHGVPVMLKDNIDTADTMMTTAGSLALEGHHAQHDAFIVQKLREAGALILGKTNLSEWANFRSSRSSSGWSSRGGQTRNPYILDRSPCGSSSGSGVAVSANFCTVAVGTETDGSVVCPSHTNGIVGIKPTLGLLSRSGIIPIAHSQDTAGPMARTVRDAAILLGAMTGSDPRDPATGQDVPAHQDYTAHLDIDGLKGARVGVVRNYAGFHEKVDAAFEHAISTMREQGASIVEEANIESKGQYDSSEFEVLLYEFKHDLNAYLATVSPELGVHTMADVIAFNEKHADKTMPYFGQEHMLKAQAKGALTEQAYKDALKNNQRLSRNEGIDAALSKHQVDVLIAPTGGPAWTIDVLNGDRYVGGSSSPAAVSGYPSITVPAGFIEGLPVGISFIASAYQEDVLLKMAYAFEQASQVRKPPQFLKHLTLL